MELRSGKKITMQINNSALKGNALKPEIQLLNKYYYLCFDGLDALNDLVKPYSSIKTGKIHNARIQRESKYVERLIDELNYLSCTYFESLNDPSEYLENILYLNDRLDKMIKCYRPSVLLQKKKLEEIFILCAENKYKVVRCK